jgi:NTE family protein
MAVAMDKFEDARELWLKIDFNKVVVDGTDGNLIEKAIGALKTRVRSAPLRKNFGRLLKRRGKFEKAPIDCWYRHLFSQQYGAEGALYRRYS